jgi:hypothetical protein
LPAVRSGQLAKRLSTKPTSSAVGDIELRYSEDRRFTQRDD